MEMSDVVLVNMPYSAIEHPSISLGYFSASLKRRGITVDTLSANIFFASEIGLKEYFLFSNYYNNDLLGEWTFAGEAFPDFHPDHDAYFRNLRLPIPEPKIRRIREMATSFLDRMADRVLYRNPRIVGCSSTFQQNCASLGLLRRIRERAPDVITVMGGANCEGPMGKALKQCFDWVDHVFSGEADDLFPEFCELILSAQDREEALHCVAAWAPPSVFRAQTGHRPTNGAERAVAKDLNSLPTPDFDDYFRDLREAGIQRQILPGLMLETSRGCWWGQKDICTFCGLNGEYINFRAKSPDVVHQDIRNLRARYGINTFEVVDNILDMKYFKTLLPAIINSGEEYGFLYEIKSNLKREHVGMLASAGIRWVQPGIESLDDAVLKVIRKGASACQNVQLLKWCREFGIFVIWNYLCDIPGESDDWHTGLLDLLPLLVHLQPPSAPGSPLRFDRFSVYHEHPDEHGLELSPAWTYSYIYPVSNEHIGNLAYFFDNHRLEVVNGGKNRPIWGRVCEELVKWRNLHYQFQDDEVWAEVTPGAPMLSVSRGDRDLQIVEDTRPCAVHPRKELRGLAARIFEICDEGHNAATVLAACRASGFPDAEGADVDRILQEFVQDKTMVFVSGRYLNLAVRAPWLPYLHMSLFPGGRVLLKRAPAPKKPEELTIEDMFGLEALV
jgi:ribosomal peptide maturation radical SAM protein 1